MAAIFEIDTILSLRHKAYDLKGKVVQGIDFRETEVPWEKYQCAGAVFLGCRFKNGEIEDLLRGKGAQIFPLFKGLPYAPYRSVLYSWRELMKKGEDGMSYDEKIYRHFEKTRHHPPIVEALAQRIHDHAMDDALSEILIDAQTKKRKKIVGIMGGHSTLRTDLYYRKVAKVAHALTRKGYLIASGGGPGIMEAANLGAYMAEQSVVLLEELIDQLAVSPHYTNEGYMEVATEVIERFPTGMENIAIPTWFYGHEPSNFFATAIAKYFSNSIREDTLLSISIHGIVYAPGSAGTTQEIFQDAAQNHYGTVDYYSPMVFLGKQRYEVDTAIFKTLQQLAIGRNYADFLYLTDEVEEVVQFIEDCPPKLVS